MLSRWKNEIEKGTQDILKLSDLDDESASEVKKPHKLPSFDNVDDTRLLKNIKSLRVSLAAMQIKLEDSDDIGNELHGEVALSI